MTGESAISYQLSRGILQNMPKLGTIRVSSTLTFMNSCGPRNCSYTNLTIKRNLSDLSRLKSSQPAPTWNESVAQVKKKKQQFTFSYVNRTVFTLQKSRDKDAVRRLRTKVKSLFRQVSFCYFRMLNVKF